MVKGLMVLSLVMGVFLGEAGWGNGTCSNVGIDDGNKSLLCIGGRPIRCKGNKTEKVDKYTCSNGRWSETQEMCKNAGILTGNSSILCRKKNVMRGTFNETFYQVQCESSLVNKVSDGYKCGTDNKWSLAASSNSTSAAQISPVSPAIINTTTPSCTDAPKIEGDTLSHCNNNALQQVKCPGWDGQSPRQTIANVTTSNGEYKCAPSQSWQLVK